MIRSNLYDYFAKLSDPRLNRNKKHNLADIIVLSILAVICGAESWDSIEEFGKARIDFLKKILYLPNGIPSHETRLYISSLNDEAEAFSKYIRMHWGVENSLHWTLDMTFREDEQRKHDKNSAQNFAIVRKIVLNLLKQEDSKKLSLRTKRLKAGWDNNFLLKILKI